VQLYAIDMLVSDGEDIRRLPLSMRKANLARLLARRPDGIFTAPFDQGEIGPDLFRKACEFGLEGLMSKHRERAYRPGTSPNWVKVKTGSIPRLAASRTSSRADKCVGRAPLISTTPHGAPRLAEIATVDTTRGHASAPVRDSLRPINA
jgi:ATP-dependent DNA ligase